MTSEIRSIEEHGPFRVINVHATGVASASTSSYRVGSSEGGRRLSEAKFEAEKKSRAELRSRVEGSKTRPRDDKPKNPMGLDLVVELTAVGSLRFCDAIVFTKHSSYLGTDVTECIWFCAGAGFRKHWKTAPGDATWLECEKSASDLGRGAWFVDCSDGYLPGCAFPGVSLIPEDDEWFGTSPLEARLVRGVRVSLGYRKLLCAACDPRITFAEYRSRVPQGVSLRGGYFAVSG
jgi:hypothetical protein